MLLSTVHIRCTVTIHLTRIHLQIPSTCIRMKISIRHCILLLLANIGYFLTCVSNVCFSSPFTFLRLCFSLRCCTAPFPPLNSKAFRSFPVKALPLRSRKTSFGNMLISVGRSLRSVSRKSIILNALHCPISPEIVFRGLSLSHSSFKLWIDQIRTPVSSMCIPLHAPKF